MSPPRNTLPLKKKDAEILGGGSSNGGGGDDGGLPYTGFALAAFAGLGLIAATGGLALRRASGPTAQ